MIYTVYNPETGQITHCVSGSDPVTLELNLQGQNYVEGSWSGQDYYIQDNQPIMMPAQPNNVDHVYKFDWNSKTWHTDAELTSQHVRQIRNNLLTRVDRVNPVWYASLTAEQQQELTTYRQLLLAVPQQSGFPTQVEWPTKPHWL